MGNHKKINLNFLKDFFKSLDYWIFLPYVTLSILGIIMVYSASTNIGNNPSTYLYKQALFFIFGFLLMLIVYKMKAKILRKFSSIIMMGLFALLLFLLFFGKTINGASGWISVGPINVQPSEFTKVFIIVFLSNKFYQMRLKENFKYIWHYLGFLLFGILLIFFQPDLGGATINFMILFVIVLSSGMKWKKALAMFGSACIFAFAALFGLIEASNHGMFHHSYQIQRIIAFTQPFNHAQDVGQQLVNSYYALSNGGVFGVGLGNSIQKKGYLPEPNTDFIMSIIAEELGLVMIVFILILLAIMVGRIILLGIRNENTYRALVCYGFATYLTVQSFFNVGGVIGMLPITGVTFPFISYGGSSMLALSICMGMVLKISAQMKRGV